MFYHIEIQTTFLFPSSTTLPTVSKFLNLFSHCSIRLLIMAGHHDPRLLYSIPNIKAYHIQNGEEQPLNPSGASTLSLLMVPTSSPFADLSTSIPQNEVPEEDFYLHLHLPPELDLPMPATTQIYHQPPRSYLIPRWDLGNNSGAFTKIEFPVDFNQDDVDTFETILAQCTAFLEKAPPPTGDAEHAPYDPRDWAAGEKMGGGQTQPGHLVLIDEQNGSVVGELGDGALIVEDPRLSHGSKSVLIDWIFGLFKANSRVSDPVEIEVSADGKRVTVAPVSDDYLRLANHPAVSFSSCLSNISAETNCQAVSLQQHGPKRSGRLPADCNWVVVPGQSPVLWSKHLHQQDQAG